MPSRRPIRHIEGVRCKRCWMRTDLCVCADIPDLKTTVRLVLLMHAAEVKQTTNTGRLASFSFADTETRVRGRPDDPMKTEGIVPPGSTGILLYPSEDAIELTPEFVRGLTKPITLVVPDGTWRQASKVIRREPALASLPRVKLAQGNPSAWGLRVAPQEGSLSTIEAIARAMGVLEGPKAQQALERLLELVVKRTLWSRGRLPLSKCEEYIPKHAVEGHRARSIKGSTDQNDDDE